MTRLKLDTYSPEVMAVGCRRCGRQPGERCKGPTGRDTSAHEARRLDVEKMDIGGYAEDKRLGSVEEKYASFHGELCDEGVLVIPHDDGGFCIQRTYLEDIDGVKELQHSVGDSYPTAAEALAAAIGPVMPAEATEKA